MGISNNGVRDTHTSTYELLSALHLITCGPAFHASVSLNISSSVPFLPGIAIRHFLIEIGD